MPTDRTSGCTLITGLDDGGQDYAAYNDYSGTGYGLWGSIGSSGVASGVSRTMNVVAQYDLAQGQTAAADVANIAWTNAQQAIATAADPGTSAPSSPFEGQASWSGSVVTWSFANSPGTQSSPFSSYIQPQYQGVIEQAIQTWAAVTGLTFEQIPDAGTSDIRIGWGSFDTAVSGTAGYTNLTPNAGQIEAGAIVRLEDPGQDALVAGSDGSFTYSGTNTQLYQLALHEIGHALGLAESSDPNSIMFPVLGSANRTLDETDVADIEALYGQSPLSIGQISAVLTQAMASFGATSTSLTTPSPTVPPAHDLVLAGALH